MIGYKLPDLSAALVVRDLRSIGGIWVWRPELTEDVAALKIQNAWRNFQGRRDIRRRVRQVCQISMLPSWNASMVEQHYGGGSRYPA